jgi:beta-aspartyl-peptidase (threonine type)
VSILHWNCTALLSLALCGILGDSARAQDADGAPAAPRWALALHGGAGSWDPGMPAEQRASLEASLRRALAVGREVLSSGGTAMDAVQGVVVVLEDDANFNSGHGAVFTRAGTHELDASLMDGATLGIGAVAGVKRIKNPIIAARLVMDKTPHVRMVGAGADAFAIENGCKEVPQSYFYTLAMFDELQRTMKDLGLEPPATPGYPLEDAAASGDAAPDQSGETVGCVALDVHGNLAAGTSTGGLTAKLPGRVGDAPIAGAGTYAHNATCAVSCTGKGEQYIRHSIAARVSWLVEGGRSVDDAAAHCLDKVLNTGEGGIIAVDHAGNITLRANTVAMPRGAADSSGRFEVAIWFDP